MMFVNIKSLQLYHLFEILDKSLPYHDITDAPCVWLFVDTIICNMLLALNINKNKNSFFFFFNAKG